MDDNSFLIPANSKKSMLILGFFNKIDLIVFGTGAVLTVILLLANTGTSTLKGAFFILLPVLIAGFLVLPVPNQHNVLTLIKNVFTYLTNYKTYYWRGWSFSNEDDKK